MHFMEEERFQAMIGYAHAIRARTHTKLNPIIPSVASILLECQMGDDYPTHGLRRSVPDLVRAWDINVGEGVSVCTQLWCACAFMRMVVRRRLYRHSC